MAKKRSRTTITPNPPVAPVAHPEKEVPVGDDVMTSTVTAVTEAPWSVVADEEADEVDGDDGTTSVRRCACCGTASDARTCPNCGQASWVK